MAWRGNLSKNLKELRILFCQSSSASSSARSFVEKNYKDLKTLNPKLPILIRECNGIEPQLWARYDQSCPFIHREPRYKQYAPFHFPITTTAEEGNASFFFSKQTVISLYKHVRSFYFPRSVTVYQNNALPLPLLFSSIT
ncbi:uncharacterized protein LOC114271157 isoform X1 [Camellia sinensis]|uniref:uncharacterized protein LOC114271157 isoform X1 n=1 Tax=Camellia sinensis TaxID=4442 RepID=UPI0010361FE8|nr:uncharacterized protein LOC114271157 isoform X1 [Camellia sinensis]